MNKEPLHLEQKFKIVHSARNKFLLGQKFCQSVSKMQNQLYETFQDICSMFWKFGLQRKLPVDNFVHDLYKLYDF